MHNRNRGFTLIEVLVALAIFAFALTAIYRQLGQSIDIAGELRDRSVALWIAKDRIALHRIHGGTAKHDANGEQNVAGTGWIWSETFSDAPRGLRKVVVTVRRSDSNLELARLSTLLRAR